MKKYLNIFLVVVLSALTVSLASCSKDDDEPDNGSSSSSTFTVNGEAYSIHKVSGASSTFTDYGSSLGSKIDAELYPAKSDETDFYPRVHISLDTPSGSLSKGQSLNITGGYVEMVTGMMQGTTYNDIQGGKITVSEISSSTAVLNFENLKMANGSQTITLNGKLSFEYEKI